MRFTPSSLGLSLLLLAISCSGSQVPVHASLDAGYEALNEGDYADAVQHFETALDGLPESGEAHLGAKIGLFKALAYTDAARVRKGMQELAADSGVTPSDYRFVATELVSAAEAQADDASVSEATALEAIALLEQGKTRFPDFEDWDAILRSTGRKLESIGNNDINRSLENLGYIGSDRLPDKP